MANLTIATPPTMALQKVFAAGSTAAKMEWDKGFASAMTRAAMNAQAYIDDQVLRLCEPMLPMKSATLRDSGIRGTATGSGEVQYTAPYARTLYYNTQNQYEGAPMRGAYWFERMKASHCGAILSGAAKIMAGQR